jgi:hypothetical protein
MAERLLVLMCSILFVACASQGSPTGGGGSSAVAVGNGCNIDAARVCAQIKNQEVTMSNTGLSADQHMTEQNSARTSNVLVPIRMPNGDEIVEVHCLINTLHHSVTSASVSTGPPMTDERVKVLRAQGLCAAD